MNSSLQPLRSVGLALLLLVPTAAFAQQAGPPDGAPGAATPGDMPTPSAQQQAARQAARAQLERLHQQARVQILGALTAQHRAAFATIVGQLAIAAVPNPRAAASELDALLSQREARGILAVAASERDNARALMESERTQFEASLTADQRARLQARMERMKTMLANTRRPAPDAGSVLLHTALGMHSMHDGPRGGPHGGPEAP